MNTMLYRSTLVLIMILCRESLAAEGYLNFDSVDQEGVFDILGEQPYQGIQWRLLAQYVFDGDNASPLKLQVRDKKGQVATLNTILFGHDSITRALQYNTVRAGSLCFSKKLNSDAVFVHVLALFQQSANSNLPVAVFTPTIEYFSSDNFSLSGGNRRNVLMKELEKKDFFDKRSGFPPECKKRFTACLNRFIEHCAGSIHS